MIYNKFINCSTKSVFDSKLESGDITDQHIVFIQDIKQIWTNGVFYAANELDPSDLSKVEEILGIIKTDGSGDKVLANNGTYVNLSDDNFPQENVTVLNKIAGIFKDNGDGSKVLANNGTYVNNHQFSGTEASKLKTVATVFKNDGSAENVLAANGTYVDKKQFPTDTATKLTTIAGIIKNDGTGTKVLNDRGSYIDVVAKYVERDRGSNQVSTLTGLPVTKSNVTATLTGATTISLSGTMNIGESITVICTPNADFTQPIPNSGSYISMDGDSLSVKTGKVFEINIYCYASGKYSISTKVQR